jgi:hypothetical protein
MNKWQRVCISYLEESVSNSDSERVTERVKSLWKFYVVTDTFVNDDIEWVESSGEGYCLKEQVCLLVKINKM